MSVIKETAQKVHAAKAALNKLSTTEKNAVLLDAADALEANAAAIIAANDIDMEKGQAKGMKQGLLDRLQLTEARIKGMADGIREVASLADPIGEVTNMKRQPNGLLIGRKRVPLGVVGVIYEARPNVTADVFALTFKTGNALILKGGSDALESNKAIVEVLQSVLAKHGINKDSLALIQETDHEATKELMRLNEYIDVLIPRGGAGLIKTVVQNATIPVIETGTGNCHIYVDEGADTDMAVNIIINAKTQRIGVCNACESLVINDKVADELMPKLIPALKEHNVEMRVDEPLLKYDGELKPAAEQDYATEYLDLIISMKQVEDVQEAIDHINANSTHHSESIITKDYEHAQRFLEEVDSAAVYVNASTRFTDGNEFGFGAEIGISTQKLHARGPMGLEALTTTKFIIYGNGQVRP